MTGINSSTAERNQEQKSLLRELLQAGRYYLSDRRVWIVLAIVAITSGVALNWGWLVAAGIAPILLLLLPCAIMCALPFCMKRSSEAGCGKREGPSQTGGPPPPIAKKQGSADR